MSDYSIDRMGRTTRLRRTGFVGGRIEGTASDSGWYRLMPDGIGATRPSGNQIQLSNLRSDIESVPLNGWRIILAQNAFLEERVIETVSSNLVTVYPDLDTSIDTAIRYILAPRLLNPLNVYFKGGGTLELAYSAGFQPPGVTGYSRQVVTGATGNPTLITFSVLDSGQAVSIPATAVEHIFYKFESASADNRISWGEHRRSAVSGGAGSTQNRYITTLDNAAGDDGLQVGYSGSDASDQWDLVTSDRQHVVVQSALDIPGATSGNKIALTIPSAVASGAAGNDWDIAVVTRQLAVQASITMPGQTSGNSLGITIPSAVAAETAGNDWDVTVTTRQLGVAATQAGLSVPGQTAGTALTMTIPSAVAANVAGNDWDLTVTNRQLVQQASLTMPGATTGNNLTLTLPSGIHTSAVGAGGNDWDVTVTQRTPLTVTTAGVQPYCDIYSPSSTSSNPRGIRVTLASSEATGVNGNSWSCQVATRTGNPQGSLVRNTAPNADVLTFTWNTTATLNTIITAVNGLVNGPGTIALLPGTSGTEVMGTGRTAAQLFGSQGTNNHTLGFSVNFAGGVNEVTSGQANPSASIDTTNKEIDIIAHNADDSLNEIRDAINGTTGLSGVAATSGSAAGTSPLSATYYGTNPTGATDFSGGINEVPRSATVDTSLKQLQLVVHNTQDSLDEIRDTINGTSGWSSAATTSGGSATATSPLSATYFGANPTGTTDFSGGAAAIPEVARSASVDTTNKELDIVAHEGQDSLNEIRDTINAISGWSSAASVTGSAGATSPLSATYYGTNPSGTTDFAGGVDEVDRSVSVDTTNKRVNIVAHNTQDSLNEVRDTINAVSGWSGAAVSSGSAAGTSALSASYYSSPGSSLTDFSGGLDITPLLATIDKDNMRINLQYEQTVDNLGQIRDALMLVTDVDGYLYPGVAATTLAATPPQTLDFARERALTETEVRGFIQDWAEDTNTDAIPASKIGTGSITASHLAANSVGSSEIIANAVGSSEIASGAVGSDQIGSGAVDTAELAVDAVESEKIADNAVGNEHLQNNSVRTAEIQDGAVTNAKVGDDAIGRDELIDAVFEPVWLGTYSATAQPPTNDGAIRFLSGSIGMNRDDLLSDSKSTLLEAIKVNDYLLIRHPTTNERVYARITAITSTTTTFTFSVTYLTGSSSTFAANTGVRPYHLVLPQVSHEQMGADVVDDVNIANDAVGAEHIKAGAVGTSELAADSVTAAKIPDNAVGNEHLQNDAVDTAEIADGAVESAQIDGDAVNADKIADDAVRAEHIQDDAVTSDGIADDAVKAQHIEDGALNFMALKDPTYATLEVRSFTRVTTAPAAGQFQWQTATSIVFNGTQAATDYERLALVKADDRLYIQVSSSLSYILKVTAVSISGGTFTFTVEVEEGTHSSLAAGASVTVYISRAELLGVFEKDTGTAVLRVGRARWHNRVLFEVRTDGDSYGINRGDEIKAVAVNDYLAIAPLGRRGITNLVRVTSKLNGSDATNFGVVEVIGSRQTSWNAAFASDFSVHRIQPADIPFMVSSQAQIAPGAISGTASGQSDGSDVLGDSSVAPRHLTDLVFTPVKLGTWNRITTLAAHGDFTLSSTALALRHQNNESGNPDKQAELEAIRSDHYIQIESTSKRALVKVSAVTSSAEAETYTITFEYGSESDFSADADATFTHLGVPQLQGSQIENEAIESHHIDDDAVGVDALNIHGTPSDNQVISWDNTNSRMAWENAAAASVGADSVGVSQLNVHGTIADNDLMAYDSGNTRLEWQSLSELLGNDVILPNHIKDAVFSPVNLGLWTRQTLGLTAHGEYTISGTLLAIRNRSNDSGNPDKTTQVRNVAVGEYFLIIEGTDRVILQVSGIFTSTDSTSFATTVASGSTSALGYSTNARFIHLAVPQLGEYSLADNAIQNRHLSDDAVDTAEIKDDAVGVDQLNIHGTPSDNQVMSWDNTNSRIEWANPPSATVGADSVGVSQLNVNGTVADNDVIAYDSANTRLEWQSLSELLGNDVILPSHIKDAIFTPVEMGNWQRQSTNLTGHGQYTMTPTLLTVRNRSNEGGNPDQTDALRNILVGEYILAVEGSDHVLLYVSSVTNGTNTTAFAFTVIYGDIAQLTVSTNTELIHLGVRQFGQYSLLANSVRTRHINDDAIVAAHLADDSVTSGALADSVLAANPSGTFTDDIESIQVRGTKRHIVDAKYAKVKMYWGERQGDPTDSSHTYTATRFGDTGVAWTYEPETTISGAWNMISSGDPSAGEYKVLSNGIQFHRRNTGNTDKNSDFNGLPSSGRIWIRDSGTGQMYQKEYTTKESGSDRWTFTSTVDATTTGTVGNVPDVHFSPLVYERRWEVSNKWESQNNLRWADGTIDWNNFVLSLDIHQNAGRWAGLIFWGTSLDSINNDNSIISGSGFGLWYGRPNYTGGQNQFGLGEHAAFLVCSALSSGSMLPAHVYNDAVINTHVSSKPVIRLNTTALPDDRNHLRIVGYQGHIHLYINGLIRATWRLTSLQQNSASGDRFGVCGDGGSLDSKRIYLYNLGVGTPDMTDLLQ